MRWSLVRAGTLALLVAAMMAGCAEQEPGPIVPAVAAATDVSAAPEFLFSLYGKSNVTKEGRDVTVRLFYEGSIFHFVTFEPEPDGGQVHELESYLLPAGFVSFDVIVDGNRVSGAGIDPSECRSGEGLAIVKVGDEALRWHGGGIEIEYGCGA